MKHVVSVSLGSSAGDMHREVEILGERFTIVREGTDGDLERAIARICALDGQVDAIGLGGIDLYLMAGRRRYVVRDAWRMVCAARRTPVVDGSALKHTLEREVIRRLFAVEPSPLAGKKVLLVSALDRFGMAEALVEARADVIFGDLIFGLGVPIPLRSLRWLHLLARMALPVLTRLPFRWLYPTGAKQERPRPRRGGAGRFYRWADVLAGDMHFIRRYLPDRIDAKIIVTQTVRHSQREELRDRGAAALIRTTPEFDGESFATNVLEAALVALLERSPATIRPEEYLALIRRLGWDEPHVQAL